VYKQVQRAGGGRGNPRSRTQQACADVVQWRNKKFRRIGQGQADRIKPHTSVPEAATDEDIAVYRSSRQEKFTPTTK
jgi:hypothetical protein